MMSSRWTWLRTSSGAMYSVVARCVTEFSNARLPKTDPTMVESYVSSMSGHDPVFSGLSEMP
jgi:hypothetical protein